MGRKKEEVEELYQDKTPQLNLGVQDKKKGVGEKREKIERGVGTVTGN